MASSGVGVASAATPRDRVSASPFDVFVLWCHDVFRTSRGRSRIHVGAEAAVWRGLFRQSKSRTALALNTLFGVPCCPSWGVQQQPRVTVALAACDDEIQPAVSQAAVVHGDETPFKQGTAKAWIGTFVAATFTYFVIRLTRAAAVPA